MATRRLLPILESSGFPRGPLSVSSRRAISSTTRPVGLNNHWTRSRTAWTAAVSGLACIGAAGSYAYVSSLPVLFDADPLPRAKQSALAMRDAQAKKKAPVDDSSPMRLRMEKFIREQQEVIVRALEELDGGRFRRDEWARPEGGGGVSCVLQDSKVFEKAGVNISVVYGTLPRAAVARMRADHKALPEGGVDQLPFFAAGLSLVLHPRNPMAPTVHLNYRYFETARVNPDGSVREGSWTVGRVVGDSGIGDHVDTSSSSSSSSDGGGSGGSDDSVWWFGGGTDLTPSYLFDEDAIHFHRTIKTVCDAHDKGYYPRFKQWCDRYFFNRHRGEARGVGGIFFDDLDGTDGDGGNGDGDGGNNATVDPAAASASASVPNNSIGGISNGGGGGVRDRESVFAFAQDCLRAFLPSYMPIMERRKDMAFTESEKEWQQIRRGRYVEFNLVHDRGTAFGLNTPGSRVESILVSLPLTASWRYMHEPAERSREQRLVDVLRNPKEWV